MLLTKNHQKKRPENEHPHVGEENSDLFNGILPKTADIGYDT